MCNTGVSHHIVNSIVIDVYFFNFLYIKIDIGFKKDLTSKENQDIVKLSDKSIMLETEKFYGDHKSIKKNYKHWQERNKKQINHQKLFEKN